MSNVTLEEKEGVAVLTINRPPVNVLDIATMQEMNQAVAQVRDDQSTKVFVVTGAGKFFSAGVDVADHTADKVDEMIAVFHQVCRGLLALPMPTVAVLNGSALGGGCEVALCCDMIVASEQAKIGQPEIKVGVFPPLAAVMFPRLMGRRKALELLLTGETIDAREAERLGLVNRVVPAEELDAAVQELVGRLTGLSGAVLRLTKRAVRQGLDKPFDDALAAVEALYLGELMRTEDAHEGLTAFMERRRPVWKDR